MPLNARGVRAVLIPLALATRSVMLGAPAYAAVSAATITGVSPQAPAQLRPRDSLSLRVEYESDQPIRLQAQAWHNGRQVPAMTNPSPVYPPGKGEAIAWVALTDGQRLDEIQVVIFDARWRPLTRVAQPMSAEWSAGAPESAPPAWVRELNDVQQRGTRESIERASGPGGSMVSGVFMSGMFVLVLAYPVLQIAALALARGTWRIVSALPLFVMVPTYAFCVFALSRGSNLWPITAIFLSPPSAIVVGFALVMGLRKKDYA